MIIFRIDFFLFAQSTIQHTHGKITKEKKNDIGSEINSMCDDDYDDVMSRVRASGIYTHEANEECRLLDCIHAPVMVLL